MERKIYQQLLDWKNAPERKPLVLFGARQVGKTFSLKQFAEREFSSIAYLDFSRDAQAMALFEGSIDPAELVPNLELYLRREIDPQRTLVVFDEVQLCDRALTSLKYFCDDAPAYHVVAAGSLLGVKVNRDKYSFPVGKVDILHMHPMDFEEYLWARGERPLAEAIRAAFHRPEVAFALHDRALEYVREYEIVGGMPEVVALFATGGDVQGCYERMRRKQNELNVAYAADMVRYADEADTPRILAAWNSLPRQLAKENRKFQYKQIKTGARAGQYESALEWLAAAGVAVRCTRVSEGLPPLKAFEDETAFKLYGADTGLLAARFEAVPADLLPADDKGSRLRGILAENYVYQQICASGATAFYWGTSSKAEVEFIGRDAGGNVIPIEVKSGGNVTARSLKYFCEKFGIANAYRVSSRNFGNTGGIVSVPLYAAHLLGETLV